MGTIHLKKLIKQKGYEKIERVLRRDKIILIRNLGFFAILFLAPIVLYFLFEGAVARILENVIWNPILVIVVSIYYLSTWVFLFAAFLDYYLDTWIVTNDRLLNIEQEGVFARTISEVDLYRIQDATSEIKGICASIFGYGNVYVQTAGKRERFVMEQIPNPHEIRKLLMDLAEEDRKYHKGSIK